MKLLFKTDPAARIRIEDAPPVPRINPAQSVKDAYDKLKPISRRTSVALRGEFTPSGKMVTNWRKLLEHDAIVAMHHRLISLDPQGYGAGRIDSFTGVGPKITGSASERSNRLLQELQGMARYAQSRRLGKRYPWGWQTPPGEGHEYGDRFMFHGTPSAWTGPYDPRKIRPQDQPAGYGVLGMYMTSQRKMAEGYRDPNRIQRRGAMAATQPTVQRWQLPRREDRFERFLPMGWNEDHSFHPEVKERLKRWYLDMCRRHLGRIPDMSAITDRDTHDYSVSHLMMIDIPAMVRAFEQRYGPNIDKIHNLQNHLQTMALTAAGYDGVRWIDSDHRGVVQGSEEGNTYSVLPVAWNKIRRVEDSKKRGPRDRTEEPEYDEMYPKPSEYTYIPQKEIFTPAPRASRREDIKGGPVNYMMNSFSESYFSMRKAKAPWNPDEKLHPSMEWMLPNKKLKWEGVPTPEKYLADYRETNPSSEETDKEIRDMYWDKLKMWWNAYKIRMREYVEKKTPLTGRQIEERERQRDRRDMQNEQDAYEQRRQSIKSQIRTLTDTVANHHWNAWQKATPEMREAMQKIAPHTLLVDGDEPFWKYLEEFRHKGLNPYQDSLTSTLYMAGHQKDAIDDLQDVSSEKRNQLLQAMGHSNNNRFNEESYWNFIGRELPQQHQALSKFMQQHNLLSPKDLQDHDDALHQATQWFAIPSEEQENFERTGGVPDRIRVGDKRRGGIDTNPAEPPSPVSSSPIPRTTAPATSNTGAMTGEGATRLSEWHRMQGLQRSLFPFAIWPNRMNNQ